MCAHTAESLGLTTPGSVNTVLITPPEHRSVFEPIVPAALFDESFINRAKPPGKKPICFYDHRDYQFKTHIFATGEFGQAFVVFGHRWARIEPGVPRDASKAFRGRFLAALRCRFRRACTEKKNRAVETERFLRQWRERFVARAARCAARPYSAGCC
jgi:hypothetical protein